MISIQIAKNTTWIYTKIILPELPQSEASTKPKHLDPTVVESPSEALACAMRETLNMGDRVADMLRRR